MQLDNLSEIELEIYSRQLLVKGWGLKQQLAVKNSSIFLNLENEIAARYLIAVGIGEIFIKDNCLVRTLKNQNPTVRVEFFNNYESLPANCLEIAEKNRNSQFESIEFETTGNKVLDGILVARKVIRKITATINQQPKPS